MTAQPAPLPAQSALVATATDLVAMNAALSMAKSNRINAEQKVSMLLVEQNASVALAVAHYGYIMENGKVVTDGPAERLAGDQDVREFYLGMGGHGEMKSFRDIKHYRRRKRWLS